MAFFSRHRSAPHLLNAGDNTYYIVYDQSNESEEEVEVDGEPEVETTITESFHSDDLARTRDTSESESPLLKREQSEAESPLFKRDASEAESPISPISPISPLFNNSAPEEDLVLLRPHLTLRREQSSTSENSKLSIPPEWRTWKKKKRRAPPPPNMSPLSLRHSCDSYDSISGMRSTDTDSVASEHALHYQTSTDSDQLMMTESRLGSNFPGELAGVENLYHVKTPRVHHLQVDLVDSHKHHGASHHARWSTWGTIKHAFRSPQLGRRKSKKESSKPSPSKKDSRSSKSSLDEGSKSPRKSESPRIRNRRGSMMEPIPKMSDAVVAVCCENIDGLDQEFEVRRVPDYERYLSALLEDTDRGHPDYEDVAKAAKRVHSMMKEREGELHDGDNRITIDGIQDRFPNDELNLHDNGEASLEVDTEAASHNDKTEALQPDDDLSKGKHSPRRQSAPSAILFRTVAGHRVRSTSSIWSNAGMGKKDHDVISQFKVADSDSNRMFIMEGPVQLARGMQIQERYLFLFTDLLLVAKQKSSTAFKLKSRVHLCDMWIASCVEEVSETTRPADRSFVLGWPMTNVVATFPSADLKKDWLLKLSHRITEEKLRDETKTLQLRVTPRDVGTSSCSACHMTINNVTQAKDVLLVCLAQLQLQESEVRDYQLWVLYGKESSPYPLIGHETPFSIKLSQIRDLTRSRSRDDIDKMTSGDLEAAADDTVTSPGHRCEFFLKQKKTPKKHLHIDTGYAKSLKRSKKSPNIINKFLGKFRSPQTLVFGLPLTEICDENFDPPEPILKLMVKVYQQGPDFSGIMRKGNNVKLSGDLKHKIMDGIPFTLEDHETPIAAGVFKEFLRCIPGHLLVESLEDQWKTVMKEETDEQKIEKIKSIFPRLPPANQQLARLTFCLLQHLAKHSGQTSMGPSNLATCVTPSVFSHDSHAKNVNDLMKNSAEIQSSLLEITTVFTPLVKFIIIKHREIFGDEILDAFVKHGCKPSPNLKLDEAGISADGEEMEDDDDEMLACDEMMVEDEMDEDEDGYSTLQPQVTMRHRLPQQPPQRQHHMARDSNSGTDSDSMHSVLSMPETGMGLRRDDSSIDSLVDREYFPNENESSPKANKSHLSPSNLSRDSGLTLSDTQLYDDDYDLKNYQRANSHLEGQEAETNEGGFYSRSADQRYDRRNPVAPPRKRVNRKEDVDRQSYSTASQTRPPFKHSQSTTQLDVPQQRRAGNLQPLLTHPPFGKRVSSDSIGEEDETPCLPSAIDFHRLRKQSDIGTLVKSDSGAHLFLGDEMLPTKYNLGHNKGLKNHYFRQSSLADSTPPVSPQSRFSQSSRDSATTDSAFSVSCEGSIHSGPQTPDEPLEKSLHWIQESEQSSSKWDDRLTLGMESSLSVSKSTSDLLAVNYDTDEDVHRLSPGTPTNYSKFKPPSPKLKSHEAEEINEFRRRPHFSLHIPSEDFVSESLKPKHSTSPPFSKSNIAKELVKGSPPPNVILKSLHPSPARRESMPMKASYDSEIVAQVRRSSADFVEPFDAVKSMSSIKPEEYFTVTPKPVMITSEDYANKAKLLKYISRDPDALSYKDTGKSLDSKRPDRPPNYQQALQRNFMIKHSIPVDISSDEIEKQTETSARAKALYEKSVQRYNEQRNGSKTFVGEQNSVKDHLLQHPTANYSSEVDSSAFLDLGSISHSLQEDVLSRRDAHAKSEFNLPSDGPFYLGLPSVSRNDSKLSDTGSSSGSSVLSESTLRRNSDSFNASIVTVSSVNSSDSGSDAHSLQRQRRQSREVDQRNMAYSRHFRPLEPDLPGPSTDHIVVRGASRGADEEDPYVTLNKNPKQMYLDSIKRYEQDDSLPTPLCPGRSHTSSCSVQSSSHSTSLLLSNVSYPQPICSSPSSPQISNITSSRPTPSHISDNNSQESSNSGQRKGFEAAINSRRRNSDTTEHSNISGAFNSHSNQNKNPSLATSGRVKSADSNTPKRSNSNEKNTADISKHRNNFLRAKRYFYHPEDDTSPRGLPNVSSCQMPSSVSLCDVSSVNDRPISSAYLNSLKHKSNSPAFVGAPKKNSGVQQSHMTENKKDLPWSVKDLKSMWDTDIPATKSSSDSTSTTTSSHHTPHRRHRTPPPYQDPPPFRRLSDTYRTSTSSNSSAGSSEQGPSSRRVSSAHVSRNRLGPQANILDSYSSSEDGYSSSLDRRSVASSSSNKDIDHSHITYV